MAASCFHSCHLSYFTEKVQIKTVSKRQRRFKYFFSVLLSFPRHYPKTSFTIVTDTPENLRLKQQSMLNSQVRPSQITPALAKIFVLIWLRHAASQCVPLYLSSAVSH